MNIVIEIRTTPLEARVAICRPSGRRVARPEEEADAEADREADRHVLDPNETDLPIEPSSQRR
jgi:hypothetical protein